MAAIKLLLPPLEHAGEVGVSSQGVASAMSAHEIQKRRLSRLHLCRKTRAFFFISDEIGQATAPSASRLLRRRDIRGSGTVPTECHAKRLVGQAASDLSSVSPISPSPLRFLGARAVNTTEQCHG